MTLDIRLRACIEGKYAQFFLDRAEQIRVLAALSQPQPVAQGEAVAARKLAVDRYVSGEEQRAFVDGYAAATPTIPTIPTGHRVVPVEVSNVATNLLDAVRADMAEGFDKISVSCSALELVCEHMVGAAKS